MTLGVGGLALYSLSLRPELRRLRFHARDLGLGLGSAAALYGIFRAGDRMARRIMPQGGREIAAIYGLRQSAPKASIAAALALIIGPGEEIFWRGLVQSRLQDRMGPLAGALAGSSLYAAVHLVSVNLTLTGAAGVAGLFWSLLYARGQRLEPLIISHVAWDLWIFLSAPTSPLDTLERLP
jgi:membrane protease YdiL (CAAX protease family)